jgi:hypothetical protein
MDAKLNQVSLSTGAGVRVQAESSQAIDATLKGKIVGSFGAGGDVLAVNTILGGTTALVEGGRIDTAGDVNIKASNQSSIQANNHASVSGGGSKTMVLAFNVMGWDGMAFNKASRSDYSSPDLGTEKSLETLAGIINAPVMAAGHLTVKATMQATQLARVAADNDAGFFGGGGYVTATHRISTRTTTRDDGAGAELYDPGPARAGGEGARQTAEGCEDQRAPAGPVSEQEAPRCAGRQEVMGKAPAPRAGADQPTGEQRP